ncbi:MAG TPA: hypothetical protein VF912_20860 [Anaeromyxobacter sp.]
MDSICVAHLVRACNGLEPFQRFLASYRRHGAGAPHRLLLVFKGFDGGGALGAHDRLLEGIPHDRVLVPDSGYDIWSYALAARQTRFDRYCFLNSYSVILDDGWLAKLARHARDGAPDLIAATGSWISHLTQTLDNPDAVRNLPLPAGRKVPLPRVLARIARRGLISYLARRFDAFPNYHVRTNCFLVRRELLLASVPRRVYTKLDAYAFESARSGLSGRCKAAGGRLLVVGRDGNAYAEQEWAASNTFWQGDQENLLVADNQTMLYQAEDLSTRAALSRVAWGDQARPAAGARRGDEASS